MGARGNVSVDPVIVMKMMLLLFWDSWCGLAKQTIQDQLIAALQNFKILLRKGRLGYFALLT